MSGLMNAYELSALKAILGSGHTAEFPNTYFVMLLTVMPADDGTGAAEVIGGGYARQSYANTDANWNVLAAPVTNKVAITFPAATANYPAPVVGWGLATAVTGGAIVFTWLLSAPANFLQAETPSFGIGDLSIGAD